VVRSTGFSIENLFGLYVTIDKEVLGLLGEFASNRENNKWSEVQNLPLSICLDSM